MNPLDKLSEAQFRTQVLAVAKRFGWRVMYAKKAQVRGRWVTNTPPGWPDLTLLRPPELVFLELKRDGGRVRPEQAVWIDELAQVPGVGALIVGPADSEAVWRLLSARAAR